jgi:hypothetical protein
LSCCMVSRYETGIDRTPRCIFEALWVAEVHENHRQGTGQYSHHSAGQSRNSSVDTHAPRPGTLRGRAG